MSKKLESEYSIRSKTIYFAKTINIEQSSMGELIKEYIKKQKKNVNISLIFPLKPFNNYP
jgi:predicted CopG family antitoxin